MTKNNSSAHSDSGVERQGEPAAAATPAPGSSQPEIRIGKSLVPAELDGRPTQIELFTMALGEEAIYLVPLKTWSQLDVFKWRVTGKLPATPAGLEITASSVKLAGESVSTQDPEGCERLELAFNKWLAAERQALEEARQKNQNAPDQHAVEMPAEQPMRFQVVTDKAGQPHIRCLEGKDTVADVACTVPGLTSLMNQGLLRKPATWKVGALRDWLELDGQMFRFKNGDRGAAELEKVLNERYHPSLLEGEQDVIVFENPASTSGFDIQFPAADNGLMENRRRHLDSAAIDLLSDAQRCRVLRKGIVVKFTPPQFVFKQKTAIGGEAALPATPDNTVELTGSDGQSRPIDLSQPVSHLGLSAAELTAILNHPAINRRAFRRTLAQQGTSFEEAA